MDKEVRSADPRRDGELVVCATVRTRKRVRERYGPYNKKSVCVRERRSVGCPKKTYSGRVTPEDTVGELFVLGSRTG